MQQGEGARSGPGGLWLREWARRTLVVCLARRRTDGHIRPAARLLFLCRCPGAQVSVSNTRCLQARTSLLWPGLTAMGDGPRPCAEEKDRCERDLVEERSTPSQDAKTFGIGNVRRGPEGPEEGRALGSATATARASKGDRWIWMCQTDVLCCTLDKRKPRASSPHGRRPIGDNLVQRVAGSCDATRQAPLRTLRERRARPRRYYTALLRPWARARVAPAGAIITYHFSTPCRRTG